MKTRIFLLIFILLITAAVSGFTEGLQEAEERAPAGPARSAASMQGPRVPYETMIRGSQLMGKTIIHRKSGKEIGQVEDLIFDLSDGYNPYLLITVEGIENIEPNDLIPLPIYLISASNEQNRLELLIDDIRTLKHILPVEDMEVDQRNGIDWTRRFYPYWQNITPAQQKTVRRRMRDLRHYRFSYGAGRRFAPTNTLRQSDLLNQQILNPEGEVLADIVDTVVSLESGGLYNLVIEPLKKYDYVNRYYTVPVNAFTLNIREETILFALKPYTLNRAPGFDETQPETAFVERQRTVERYWSKSGFGINMRIGMRVIPLTLAEADSVLDVSVTNHMYQNLGTIEDLMVERYNETVSYAVIDFSGFFEIRGRRTLIPFNALTLNRVFDMGYVNLDQQEVESAPYFEEGSLPKTDMFERWDVEIEEYWRRVFFLEEYEKRQRKIETVSELGKFDRAQALPLTSIIEFSVKNSEGQLLGEIENLIIDMETEKVLYALISREGEPFGDPAVVPFSMFLWDAPNKEFYIGIDKGVLAEAPKYENISESREAGWQKTIQDFWKGY